ncbi:TSUP family transporter [Streptomyces sp. NPDC007905]|uniref:TSUP family transporter n=1 Tax=Streptomyces sp. NPDC007905 TaxID=3364788 RepID=UPI0036E22B4D
MPLPCWTRPAAPAMLGGALAGRLPAAALTAAFAVVAGVAAVRMPWPRPASDTRGAHAVAPSRVRHGRAGATGQGGGRGSGLGAVTGVLGAGGGFLAVPAPASVLGLRMRDAVGTSLPATTVDSPAAPAMRAGTADGLDRAVIAPFAGAAILGAWDGRRLASKRSGSALQRICALVLLAVTAFMMIDALV